SSALTVDIRSPGASRFYKTREVILPYLSNAAHQPRITPMTTEPIHVSVDVDAPPKDVWDALTRPELVKQYLFGTDMKTTLQVGSPITFSGTWEGKSYEDGGTVLEVTPLVRLKYTYWSSMSGLPRTPEREQIVSFDLLAQSGGTRLTLTQSNFPSEQAREHTIS